MADWGSYGGEGWGGGGYTTGSDNNRNDSGGGTGGGWNDTGGYNALGPVSDWGMTNNPTSPTGSWSGGSGSLANGWWNEGAWSNPAGPSQINGLGDFFNPVSAPINTFSAPPPNMSYTPMDMGPPAWAGNINVEMPSAPGQTAPQDTSFMDSDFMKGLRKFGLFAGRQNPNVGRAMGAVDAANAIGEGDYGPVAGLALGAITKNPLAAGLGGILGTGLSKPTRSYSEEGGATIGVDDQGRVAPTTSQRLGRFGMQTIGGLAGGAIGGPAGAMIGSDIMGRIGQGPSGPAPDRGNYAGGNSSVPQANGNGNMVGALAGGLMNLYGLNRANKTDAMQQQALTANQSRIAEIQAQLNSGAGAPKMPGAPHTRAPNFNAVYSKLDQMFGPKSGVASEMRSQLERKDAAAGRRSQYGPREVQLMAELTRLRAQAEPGYMNAEVGAANAANQGALGAYQGAVNMYNSQMADRQQNWQRQLAALQLGQSGSADNYRVQQARDQRRQQELASLYSMGRESGLFNWAGNTLGSYF